MGLLGVVILFLMVIGIILFALRAARYVQRSIDRAKENGNKKAERGFAWLGHIHYIWWMLGAVAGGLRYAYEAWKAAPVGSAERLGWGALLAAIAALGLYVVVKLVDRELNPPHKTPSPSGE